MSERTESHATKTTGTPNADKFPEEMQVVSVPDQHTLEKRNIPVPQTPMDGILLQTECVTICSTDVSHYKGGLDPQEFPFVPGHEYVGRVVDVGPDVEDVKLGERVVYFGQGDFNGLAEYRALRPLFPGQTDAAPFKTSRYFHDDERAATVKISDNLESKHAAVIEPTTAVLRAILWNPPRPGDNILILGAGPCGLIAGECLKKMFGVGSVAVADKNRTRQDKAKQLFADACFASGKSIKSFTSGAYDYVFDALPPLNDESVDTNPRRAAKGTMRPGGKYVLFGASELMQKMDLWMILAKGVHLVSAPFDVGVFPMSRTARIASTAKSCVEHGIVSAKFLVDREVNFSDVEGIKYALDNHGHQDFIKTAVHF